MSLSLPQEYTLSTESTTSLILSQLGKHTVIHYPFGYRQHSVKGKDGEGHGGAEFDDMPEVRKFLSRHLARKQDSSPSTASGLRL
jgi:hypothetical protein